MRLSESIFNIIPWYLKPFFWFQKRKYGQALSSSKVWATNPRLFLSTLMVYGALTRQKAWIDAELRSLVGLRVSQLNWCLFCMDLNTTHLIRQMNNPDKFEHLEKWQESDLFTPMEKAALDYAEQMCLSLKGGVCPDCFKQLQKFFKEQAIVELTAYIAFQIMSCKFNKTLDIKPQGLCKLNH
tara:strand:- start:1674 stop:2222 length:549 start_codon:yes stop_codon:yes gene_type:complete